MSNRSPVPAAAARYSILAAFLAAFQAAPYQPPKAVETGATEKFAPAEALLGRWNGSIRTSVREIPAGLTFGRGLGVVLEIDGKKYSPSSVKTELVDMTFKDGVFHGLFWGRIDTPDTAGLSHVVFLSVKLRGNRLTGSASAVSSDGRRTFCLPHWIKLAKPVG
jgi:hypothetical protein